jgi:type IV secretion system protein VirB9
LVEVSDLPDSEPDLKVFIELKDQSMISAAEGPPKFVPAQEVDDYRRQAELAKEEARQAKRAVDATVDAGIGRFIGSMRFPYRFEAGKKPFFVRAMFTDDKFTYIYARPEEAPTLYEIKDGKPNLVNFDYKNGVYTAQKVVDQGYLVIGKAKLGFKREE